MTPVLIKEAVPFSDKSSEGVLGLVRSIIEQPGVVRFELDARRDSVSYWRAVSPEEASERSISFRDALRNVPMEEYDPRPNDGDDPSSFEQLFEMFEMIEDAGCVPTHILIGATLPEFRQWLPIRRRSKSAFGVPILQDVSLEKDVLVVCGAEDWNATPMDITFAVKVTL